MRNFRLGVIAVAFAMLVAGCDGGTSEGTTMPTGPLTTPPEIEQMKAEMQKHIDKFSRSGNKAANRSSAGHKS
jgi:hypothetical protein